jgi:hypothetical protein
MMKKYQVGDLLPDEWVIKVSDIRKRIRKLEKVKYNQSSYPKARILIAEFEKWVKSKKSCF